MASFLEKPTSEDEKDTPETYFDLLPPEVLEYLARFLPSRDVISFTQVSARNKTAIMNSPRILRQLTLKSSVIRKITDSFLIDPIRRCDTTFIFRSKDEDRLRYVMDLVGRIPTGRNLIGLRRVVLIIADGRLEAEQLFRALHNKKEDVYLSYGYIPPYIEYKMVAASKNFYLILARIDVNFSIANMAAVIAMEQPECVDDYLEVQSFNPRRIYQVLPANAHGFKAWEALDNHLKPFASTRPVPENSLIVNRRYFVDRAIQKDRQVNEECRKRAEEERKQNKRV